MVVARVVIAVLALGDVDAAGAAADNDANIGGGGVDTSVPDGLARGEHRDSGHLGRSPQVRSRIAIGRELTREGLGLADRGVRHVRGHTRRQMVHRGARDRNNAARAGNDSNARIDRGLRQTARPHRFR